jgi:hypothetical protein
MTEKTTMKGSYEPDPDDAADDELAAERAGQSSTAEEAMDAVTDEDGHSEESAYTPTPGLQQEPGAEEDPDVREEVRSVQEGHEDAGPSAGEVTDELKDASTQSE